MKTESRPTGFFIKSLAGIKDLRIHDLRHFATTMLFIEGVSYAIIWKMTEHRTEEIERYKHLSPEFSKQTTELIAGKLVEELKNTASGTFWSQSPENDESRQNDGLQNTDSKDGNGGADGARTRDLQRDRAKFFVPDLA